MDQQKGIDIAIGMIIASCFVFMGFLVIKDYKTQAGCLSKGYPEYRYVIGEKSYCIKRVDQTDIVVPLESIP